MLPAAGPLATVFGLFVCGALLALPAMRLLSLYLEREISALEFLIASSVLLSFAMGIFVFWQSHLKWLLMAMLVTICVAVVLAGRRQQRKLAEKLHQEDLERCYRLLQFDPRNVEAHSRLGDLFMNRGLVDEAIASYQNAVVLAPQDAKERGKLQRAIEHKQKLITEGADCPRCGTRNPRAAPYCIQCRFPLSARHELWDALRTKETLRASQIGAGICLGVVVVALGVQIATGHVSVAVVATAFVLLFLMTLLFLATRVATR